MEKEILKELPACPVETTLTLISDKWKVLILRDLMPGTKRFGELKKSIGHVTQKVLTAQLRQMEESGLLTRKVYAEVPPRVEYTLTELGYSLKPVLDAMREGGISVFACTVVICIKQKQLLTRIKRNTNQQLFGSLDLIFWSAMLTSQ